MLPVEQPFKTYTGIDGKPLTNGSVYFGVAGQDPITHPVTVYWDAGGTLPISQPARTVNGYIVNDSGSAANVFYNGAYSTSVIDSKGRQVFYAQTSDSFSIASAVSGFTTQLAASAGAALVGSATWYAPSAIGFDATKLPDGATVICAGRSTAQDGGGGVFTYSKTSTQTPDNGLVFAPIAGGRLFRQGWSVVGFNGAIRPAFFGAKGDGATDSATSLQAAINTAFSFGVAQEINLGGASYVTSQPLIYPAGGYVALCGGTIKAGATFPTGRYVIEVTSQTGGLVNHDLRFRDLTIDGAHRGGCLQIDNYIRVVVDSVNFLHFPTQGLWLRKTLDSHECIVVKCYAFEYLYNESGYLTPTATSVGFQIDAFDNHLVGVVSYYTGIGMVINGQYNMVSQPHLGGATWAMRITQLAAFTSIMQPYIDSAAISWENPWNTEIIGGKFLHATTDATFAFIVLKPLSAGLAISGLKVMNCSFHNSGAALVDSFKTDTSAGGFNVGQIINCHVYGNSFANVKQKGTRVRKSLFQNAATTWTFNFDNDLAFGVVQWLQDSYYDATGGAPVSRVTSISGNTVTITNSVAGNGTAFIEVDVNTGTS